MSFSEYLNKYIKENNITVAKVISASGIDRSTFYRYLKGDRIPKSVDKVEAIADAMCMTSDEREILLQEYDKSNLGEDVVNSYHYMRKLLDNLSNVDGFVNHDTVFKHNISHYDLSDSEELVELTSQQSIVAYTMRMLHKCARSSQPNKRVMLAMQPSYSEIQGLLIPLLGKTDVKIDQVICFEKTIEKCYINMEILGGIFAPSFSLPMYNVYYHYENVSSHQNSDSLLPNLIIADGCAIMFDYEMDSGFFTMNPTLVNYLTNRFNRLCGKCFALLEKGLYANVVGDLDMVFLGEYIGSLFDQPCIAPCLDRNMLRNRIYDSPYKEQLIDMLYQRNGDWNGTRRIGGTTGTVSCCTKSGVEQLMSEGRITEFPEQYYSPLSREDKINLLRRMIWFVKNEKTEYIILKEGIRLPKNMQVFWNPTDRRVSFRYIKSDRLIQIDTKEISVYNTVANFIEYIRIKKMAYSKDECIEFLSGLIAELEKNPF